MNRVKHYLIDVWRAHAANRLKPGQVAAVDFDGTLCEVDWPDMGRPYERFMQALHRAQLRGVTLILNTCREGKKLEEAVNWLFWRAVWFHYVNQNTPDRIAQYGGDCRKISADIYFDDKGAWI